MGVEEIRDKEERSVKDLIEGDLVLYRSPVSKEVKYQKMIITKRAYQLGENWYIDVRLKENNSKGVPTLVNYLKAINDG